MWYGQTPANYREVFRVAREAGAENPDVPVVMLFDEVDSTASARGQSLTRADDRTVQAFMHELDGMEDLGNVIVLAATNRWDALDSALLRPGRFGDLVIEVPRPGMDAARDIFGKYLLGDLPYATDGGRDDQEGIRREIIDAATSSIYAPNGDADLATITFRDNTRRTVTRSDLTSGAVIAGIAAAGIERAMWRHATTGRAGIRLEDVLEALHDEFTTAAAALTPANCRNHVGGLPQDADVVSVKQHVRKVRPHRYLTLSVA